MAVDVWTTLGQASVRIAFDLPITLSAKTKLVFRDYGFTQQRRVQFTLGG